MIGNVVCGTDWTADEVILCITLLMCPVPIIPTRFEREEIEKPIGIEYGAEYAEHLLIFMIAVTYSPIGRFYVQHMWRLPCCCCMLGMLLLQVHSCLIVCFTGVCMTWHPMPCDPL